MKAILSAFFLLLFFNSRLIFADTFKQVQPITKAVSATPAKKVIIDTDMGWDDILSILYLMKNQNIDIVGITVTGCGETNLRWGKTIALSLMELGNRFNMPIAIGSEKPLAFNHVFPQPFRNDMNDLMGLLGSMNSDDVMKFDPRPAWQFLSEVLNQATEPITILSLGGFNTLARMLQEFPNTKIEMIKHIFAMGGAVYVDGNVALLNNARKDWDQGPRYSSNSRAEWNIFVDPVAAKIIFDSTIPLTLISLDACNEVMLSSSSVETITATDDLARLAKQILQMKTGTHNEGIPVPIFDPLATMIMADGLSEYEFVSVYLDVDVTDSEQDNTSGRTFTVEKGSRKINVVQGVSGTLFTKGYKVVMNK